MTRVIRASSRQIVIPWVEDCSIVVWLLAGSYSTGVSTPEAGRGKGRDYKTGAPNPCKTRRPAPAGDEQRQAQDQLIRETRWKRRAHNPTRRDEIRAIPAP